MLSKSNYATKLWTSQNSFAGHYFFGFFKNWRFIITVFLDESKWFIKINYLYVLIGQLKQKFNKDFKNVIKKFHTIKNGFRCFC